MLCHQSRCLWSQCHYSKYNYSKHCVGRMYWLGIMIITSIDVGNLCLVINRRPVQVVVLPYMQCSWDPLWPWPGWSSEDRCMKWMSFAPIISDDMMMCSQRASTFESLTYSPLNPWTRRPLLKMPAPQGVASSLWRTITTKVSIIKCKQRHITTYESNPSPLNYMCSYWMPGFFVCIGCVTYSRLTLTYKTASIIC